MWKPEYAETRRRRYREDSECRERRKSQGRSPEANAVYMREYYQRNKHRWKKRTPEQRAKYNAARRERYAADESLRERYREASIQWRKDNPERALAQDLRAFGVSVGECREMLARQGGVCAICQRKRVGDARGTRLHVDHCHSTGRIRGLLCGSCNIGLGKFADDAERIARAALYLRKAHSAQTEGSDQ